MLNSCALDGKVVNGRGIITTRLDTQDVGCQVLVVKPVCRELVVTKEFVLAPVVKQPWERISRTVDYSDVLDIGDVLERTSQGIPRVLVVIDKPGLTVEVVAAPAGYADVAARLWIQGGQDREHYKVTLRAFTRGGERLERELRVAVKEV